MEIDITKCKKVNIVDSCSVSNLLSSWTLYKRLDTNGFHFSITKFVEYECLYKSRADPEDGKEIKSRLIECRKKEKFAGLQLSIADLQDQSIIGYSNRLGIGELSSIAFAKKIGQCFMTDDQKARRFAHNILGPDMVQTTPHMVGWLFYTGLFSDSDLELLITEHNNMKRPLERYFRQVYDEACRIKLITRN